MVEGFHHAVHCLSLLSAPPTPLDIVVVLVYEHRLHLLMSRDI